jgi:branched-chain amino acid transport system ATP-binding protein
MEKEHSLAMEILKVEGLTKSFGGVVAVKDVSFSVENGEHLAIIGPNGAGKTTLFNLLTGFYKPTSGKIYYQEQSIANKSDYERTHLGISRSFQITSLFNQLSVMENTVLALQGTKKYRYQMMRDIKSNHDLMSGVQQLLESMALWEIRNEPVHCISYGQQRKLEIALSMASEPRLLLLDEPSCGLTTVESDELSKMICNLEEHITVICVAHDMDLVFSIASRILVLHYGEIITEGSPEQIKASSKVKEIYMGNEETD